MRTSPGATLSAIGPRLAVLGALVLAAVGLRAADLQDASNRGWRLDDLSGSTPYLAVAAGVGLLVVLGVIAWAMTGSRKGQLTGRRRRSTWATLLLLGAGALVVVLLPPRGPAAQLAGGRPAPVPLPLPKGHTAPAATSHSGAAVVLLLLAVVLLTMFLAARGRRARSRRQRLPALSWRTGSRPRRRSCGSAPPMTPGSGWWRPTRPSSRRSPVVACSAAQRVRRPPCCSGLSTAVPPQVRPER